MRNLFALAALAAVLAFGPVVGATPARAQNATCPDVAAGDVSNRCANTRFVATGFPTLPGNNIWTGTNTFNPVAGNAVTINPAAGTTDKGITVNQTSPVGGTTAGPLAYNAISINNQIGVTGAGATNGLLNASTRGFSVALTDGAVVGSNSIAGLFELRNTIGTSVGDRIALAASAYSNQANNGFLMGLNAFTQITGAAAVQNTLVAAGLETGITSGATATSRMGLEITNIGTGQGTFDSAIVVDSQTAGGQFKAFVTFGSPTLTQAPLDTGGNMFVANQAMTVLNVMNLTNMTVTGNILSFPNATLTGAGQLNLGAAGTTAGIVKLAGLTQGTLTQKTAANVNANSTITWPNGTTDFSATGGTAQVLKQTSAGGAFTVAQLAASDLSNGTTGSGAVVLATSPTLVTPTLGAASATSLTLGTPLAVASGGTACAAASGTCLDNIAGFGGAGLLARTGAGAYSARTIGSGAGIAVTNGDGVAGNPSIAVSALSTNTNLLISSGVAAGFNPNSTEFAGAGAICASGSETACPVPISAPATLKNLYAATADAPSAGQTYTFTLRKNLADTTITCVMSGASAKTCNDTTHTVSVVAGDIVDMKLVSSATATTTFGPTFTLTAVTTSP